MTQFDSRKAPQSLLSRISELGPNLVFGLGFCVLGVLSFGIVESRMIAQDKALDQGALDHVSIASGPIDATNEGQLVHLSGTATTEQSLSDELFGVTVPAPGLRRRVEMYQWQEYTETASSSGNWRSSREVIRYRKQWDQTPLDHRGWRYPEGHENPGPLPFESKIQYVDDARLGAFRLRDEQLWRAGEWKTLPADTQPAIPAGFEGARRTAEGLYIGSNPDLPAIGDVRILFTMLVPLESTVVAQQIGDQLLPYPTRSGNTLDLVEHGVLPAASLFKTVARESIERTWLLRALGFFSLLAGLMMVLHSLAKLRDLLPLIATVVAANLYVVSFLLASLLSLLAIAAAWLPHKPVVATDLLFIATAVVIGLILRLRASRAAA